MDKISRDACIPADARSAAVRVLKRKALSGLLHDHVFPALVRKDWEEVDAVAVLLRDYFRLGSYAFAVRAFGRVNRYLPPVRGLVNGWDRRVKAKGAKSVQTVRRKLPNYSQLLQV